MHLLGRYEQKDEKREGRHVYFKAGHSRAEQRYLWFKQGMWYASTSIKFDEQDKEAPLLAAEGDANDPDQISKWCFKSKDDSFLACREAPDVICQAGEAGSKAYLERAAAPAVAFHYRLEYGYYVPLVENPKDSRQHMPMTFHKKGSWFPQATRHVYETHDEPPRMLWYADGSWYVGDPADVGTVLDPTTKGTAEAKTGRPGFTASYYYARDDALLPEDILSTWRFWSNGTEVTTFNKAQPPMWKDATPMRAAGGADGKAAMVASALLALRYELTPTPGVGVQSDWALTRLNDARMVGAPLDDLSDEVEASRAALATLINVTERLNILIDSGNEEEEAHARKEIPIEAKKAASEQRLKDAAQAKVEIASREAIKSAKAAAKAATNAAEAAKNAEEQKQKTNATDSLRQAERLTATAKGYAAEAKGHRDDASLASNATVPAAENAAAAMKEAVQSATAEAKARTAKATAEAKALKMVEVRARVSSNRAEKAASVAVARANEAAVAFEKAKAAAAVENAAPSAKKELATAKAKKESDDKEAASAIERSKEAADALSEAKKDAEDNVAASAAMKAKQESDAETTKKSVKLMAKSADDAKEAAIKSAHNASHSEERARTAWEAADDRVDKLKQLQWLPDWLKTLLLIAFTLGVAFVMPTVYKKYFETDPETEELREQLKGVAVRYQREHGAELRSRNPRAVPHGKKFALEQMKFADRSLSARMTLVDFMGFDEAKMYRTLGGVAPIRAMEDEWTARLAMCTARVVEASEKKRVADQQASGVQSTKAMEALETARIELKKAESAKTQAGDDIAALMYVTQQRAGEGDGPCEGFDCDADGLRADRKNERGLGKNLADFVDDANALLEQVEAPSTPPVNLSSSHGSLGSSHGSLGSSHSSVGSSYGNLTPNSTGSPPRPAHSNSRSISGQLNEAHVAALRLYTTCAYTAINEDLRSDNPDKHFKFTVFFIADALIKLRKANQRTADPTRWVCTGVEGVPTNIGTPLELPSITTLLSEKTANGLNAECTLSQTEWDALETNDELLVGHYVKVGSSYYQPQEGTASMPLYKGVKNRELSEGFKEGIEQGLLSTTSDLYTAVEFAVSERGVNPILFRLRPSGDESKGAQIKFLSVYPREQEYLYPPLTILDSKSLKTRQVTTEKGFMGFLTGGFAITVVDLEPSLSQR